MVSINAIVFPLIDIYSAIAAGVGFGAAQSFMYYAVVVSRALGPGALFNPHCTHFSSFFTSAWMAFFFNVMHICWMIMSFDAFRFAQPLKVGLVVLLHGAASGIVRHDTTHGLQEGMRIRQHRSLM